MAAVPAKRNGKTPGDIFSPTANAIYDSLTFAARRLGYPVLVKDATGVPPFGNALKPR